MFTLIEVHMVQKYKLQYPKKFENFDNSLFCLKQIGDRWDEVKDKVIRAHQQPCMVVYVSPDASPIDIKSAPKNVEVAFEKLQQLEKEVELESTQQTDHFK